MLRIATERRCRDGAEDLPTPTAADRGGLWPTLHRCGGQRRLRVVQRGGMLRFSSASCCHVKWVKWVAVRCSSRRGLMRPSLGPSENRSLGTCGDWWLGGLGTCCLLECPPLVEHGSQGVKLSYSGWGDADFFYFEFALVERLHMFLLVIYYADVVLFKIQQNQPGISCPGTLVYQKLGQSGIWEVEPAWS